MPFSTKATGWRDKSGKLHAHQKDADVASIFTLLVELTRRLDRSMPSQQRMGTQLTTTKTEETVFLAAASWFKENPELVRKLINYKMGEYDYKLLGMEAPKKKEVAKLIDANQTKTITDSEVRQTVNKEPYAGYLPQAATDEDLLDYIKNRLPNNPGDISVEPKTFETFLGYRRRINKPMFQEASTEPVKGEDR